MPLFSKPPSRATHTVLCVLAAVIAIAWVFHRQWLEGEPFVGNFDRLNGGSLPLRLHEIRASQTGAELSSWTDNVFMGLNLGAHGAYHLGPSPLSWLMARFPAANFLQLSAAVAALLLGMTGLGAYATLRRFGFSQIAGTAGATCYACSTIITVRLAQSEGFAYNYLLGPWLFYLLLECRGRRPLVALAGLGAILYFLLDYSFLQETAYLWLVAAGFTLVDARVHRSLRLPGFLLAASLCATIAAGPRILEAQRELALLQRTPTGKAGEVVTFASSYSQQHLTSREGLRFFADGIFGRFPGEAGALGNNINLNEGFQVYASTFASLVILTSLLWLLISATRRPGDGNDPPWPVRYAGAVVVLITLLVLTRPGLGLLYYLFLRLDFSHGRLVAAALFPMAILLAYGLDRLRPALVPIARLARIGLYAIAAAAALATFTGFEQLRHATYEPGRLDLDASPGYHLRSVYRLLRGSSMPVEAPVHGMARWTAAGVIALAWQPVPGATVEVEMQQGDSPFVVMGRNELNRYTLGSLQPGGQYRFRLRAWRGQTPSPYSAVFAARQLSAGIPFEQEAPPSGGEKTWLQSGEVVFCCAAILAFAAWLLAWRLAHRHPVVREGLVAGLGILVVVEALAGLEFRLNGPHTHSFPVPFQRDNFFVSAPGTLTPPTIEARRALHHRLERNDYRSVLIEPAEQFYSATLHVPMAWDLRTPQGGWAGVPRRLAVLPWPDGVVSMRRLIFRPETDLPWDLLGILNVKYAATVDTQLYFNTSREASHSAPAGSLRVETNPRPVTPRQFFTHRTIPTERLVDRREFPVPMPSDPVQASLVEGAAAARDWPAEDTVRATYAGDHAIFDFAPRDEARFLVINELYHPDWQARTPDGRRLAIHPVNTVMRGIEIPPGIARVELEFRPFPGPALAIALRLAGLLLLAGACVGLRSPRDLQPTWTRFGAKLSGIAGQLPKPWVLVLAAYGLLYGILLLATDGYPYVFDNNESYSSLWHARSLYENGIAQTKGLTDEVFSPAPAASPYIHSHQGNFPRLFTFVFYALGLHSIGPQIWVATFTVGLASLWLAFRFLTRLANPTFAALTCLLLMTDYLFFTQWQVGLYNIWHGFFFFSSLTCIQALGEAERRGRWFLLTALNFAALFYWEYVFTAFVVALCGLYALVSYWRRPRLVVMAASAVATGAAVAAGTLLLQLTAYMGWANVMEDVRLTLTARNAAADPVLLEKVTSFYREHRIIFWHNFMEAAPLRTFQALWDSLYEFHLKYYSPALLYAAVVLGAGWLLGCWSWAQRSWRRVFPLLALAGLVVWLWPWVAEGPDSSLRAEYVLTSGGATLLAAERGLLALVTLVALACAGAGNRTVLGDATGRVAGLLPLLLCGAAAYGLTYRIFTGYIYSGYLHRFVPLPVFLTVPVLGLALSVLFQAGRQAWALASTPTPSPAARLWRRVPGVLVLAAFAGIAAYWAMLQVTYASIIPPDSYAFLKQLERPPFKGHSVVSNTYPAPMAARTGSWGYADPSILSGRITLTPDGFTPERDLKYLWFADRDTNPAYRKPGLAVTVVQRPNFGTALQLQREQAAAPAGRIPLAEASGLAQRTRPLQQAFLHHRMAYSDGDRASVVVLDWDFPPFLRPDLGQFLPAVAGLPLQQKLALSESTQDLRRRWRVVLTPKPTPAASGQVVELREALIDGRPVFSAAELAAAGWLIEPHAGGASWRSDGRTIRPLSALAEGLSLRLVFGGGPHAGQVTVETNDLTDTLDLRARTPVERAFTFTAANPHGRYTYVPALAPGLCVQTILPAPTGHNVAELRYHYAQQDGLAEAGSIVRLYGENPAGRWELADTIIFLGPAGIPVRLAEFQQANPDAVAEHARIAAGGDPRTFAQWLADHLAAHPKEWSRPGIVQPALPPPALTGGDPATVTRRVPLPAGSGRWQFSVSPGTRTKTGTEYFGLPFTLPTARHGPVKFHPPAAATDAPLAFGRLKIRLRFPANPGSGSEPLVTTGGREAGDFLYVQYVDSQHIRIGFDHWFKGGPLSPPIAVDFTQEHELEISLGSLFPAREDVVFASVSAAGVESVKNRVRVILDGQSVLDSAGECYETGPGGVTVGRNAIFGTSCSPEFTGEILSIERSWPDIK